MNRGFDRALSDGDVLRRRASFLQRIHIDGWLLFLLLILGAIGLFVLYSAGGRDQGLLIKQASSFGVWWWWRNLSHALWPVGQR